MNAECELILMRQFDADCQQGSPLPDDVEQHLSTCASCRQAWQESVQLDVALSARLLEQPSNRLYRSSYIAAINADNHEPTKWFWARQIFMALILGCAAGMAVLLVGDSDEFKWLSGGVFVMSSAMIFLISLLSQLREAER